VHGVEEYDPGFFFFHRCYFDELPLIPWNELGAHQATKRRLEMNYKNAKNSMTS
jgi:hypothetical protein